jgi:hypothetical protein
VKVHDVEPCGDEAERLLVATPREEARRQVRVVIGGTFDALGPAVHAEEEQPAGTQDRPDRRQDRWQVGVGDVQQAVDGEHRVERAARKFRCRKSMTWASMPLARQCSTITGERSAATTAKSSRWK